MTLNAVLQYLSTITMWNRVEGRPRAADFDRAMKAEVRDALWLLSKQWQMGEFQGDDAASPVLARAHFRTTKLSKLRLGQGPTEPFSLDLPLETQVERQPIPFVQAGRVASLDIRLLMGRHFLKLVSAVDPDLRIEFIAKYPVAAPDPNAKSQAAVCAHGAAFRQFAVAAGRVMDGYSLLEHLNSGTTARAYDGIASVDSDETREAIDEVTRKWLSWFERQFSQPGAGGNPSWKPEYLEHQFACSAPVGEAELVLEATAYHHGHLDWYNVDVAGSSTSLPEPTSPEPEVPEPEPASLQGDIVRTFVPSSVTFGGMPHSRWWTFEDWNTNLAFVNPDTPDLDKLLLLDFLLIYSNDWFMLPVTLEVGTLSRVAGLLVTDVFGEKTWVRAASAGADEDWQRWAMYGLATAGTADVPANLTSLVLPVAGKVQEGKPLEEVLLFRDEVANMVWGAESRIPLPTGRGQSGKQSGEELSAKLQQLVQGGALPPTAIPPAADVRFQLLTTVPEHWIPFVPVHIDGQMRHVQLQRAAMPRLLEGDPDPPEKVEPRTSLLRHGLDADSPQRYFLHEEEVTRAGVRVTKTYQRTRWFDGRVLTWLGTRKQQGRGEGRSGLSFDQLLPTPRDPSA